jgi:hypothetical protein
MPGFTRSRSTAIFYDEQENPNSFACANQSAETHTGSLSTVHWPRSHVPIARAKPSAMTCAQQIGSRAPFKIHKCLTIRAASFKSLYQKRPPGTQLTDTFARGRNGAGAALRHNARDCSF